MKRSTTVRPLQYRGGRGADFLLRFLFHWTVDVSCLPPLIIIENQSFLTASAVCIGGRLILCTTKATLSVEPFDRWQVDLFTCHWHPFGCLENSNYSIRNVVLNSTSATKVKRRRRRKTTTASSSLNFCSRFALLSLSLVFQSFNEQRKEKRKKKHGFASKQRATLKIDAKPCAPFSLSFSSKSFANMSRTTTESCEFISED